MSVTVRIEREGAVTTVILARPEVRNAFDNETAHALADAFREFDADDEARVAVLWGEGGSFCAGADPQAVARGERPRRHEGAKFQTPQGPPLSRATEKLVAVCSHH